MRDDDELDSLLDAALRTYADPVETPGLDGRILAAVRAGNGKRWWNDWTGWRLWAIAVPALAVVSLLILLPVRSAFRGRERLRIAAVSAPSEPLKGAGLEPDTSGPKTVGLGSRRVRASTVVLRADRGAHSLAASLPKRAVFPTPQALTPQEEALVALASHHPAEATATLSEDKAFAPLTIAAIEIPLLNASDKGGN